MEKAKIRLSLSPARLSLGLAELGKIQLKKIFDPKNFELFLQILMKKIWLKEYLIKTMGEIRDCPYR